VTKAIVVRTTGGPEVLRLENITVGNPGPGEIKLRQSAIGVNFIDTYFRTGLYKVAAVPGLPAGAFIPGQEGVGVVEAVGAGVTDLKEGDRVAYGNGPTGGYAESRLIPASSVVKVPAGIKDEQVAGMMLRGLTVWYLIRALHVLKPGETVLFHAAAGGVGLIFCQWARHIGATVIGTVGSPDKVKLAKDAGCTHTILYKQEDWVAKVKELTGGKGVSVVYDGVGKDTFWGGLDCLARRGVMCSFGNASGPAPAIEPALLSQKGSLFLTRPRLGDYIAQREDHVRAADELFDVVTKGHVKIDVGQSYTLDQAAHAHSDLESRKTTGSTILVV
jgi:NADPH2:quinone reductase